MIINNGFAVIKEKFPDSSIKISYIEVVNDLPETLEEARLFFALKRPNSVILQDVKFIKQFLP